MLPLITHAVSVVARPLASVGTLREVGAGEVLGLALIGPVVIGPVVIGAGEVGAEVLAVGGAVTMLGEGPEVAPDSVLPGEDPHPASSTAKAAGASQRQSILTRSR